MDGHSKREVLEIFRMNKKNVITRFLFLNHQLHNNLRFLVKWSPDISCDLLILKNVKDDDFFKCAKFCVSAITYAEGRANNSFSTGKPLSPRL